MSTPTPKPDLAKLLDHAVAARRLWLHQKHWNDARARMARNAAMGTLQTYAVASGLTSAQATAEVERAAKEF